MEVIKYYKRYIENVGKINISDYTSYNNNMELSIDDKLFFINKLDFDVIVDFGCANGVLLEKISNLKPNIMIIGYDLDTEMIKLCSNKISNGLFTDKWSVVIDEIGKYKKPLLNLSSVIHEVYSYSHPKVVSHFWTNNVFNDKFKYIVIRDMLPSSKIDSIDMNRYQNDVKLVIDNSDRYYLKSFQKNWGNIDDNYRIFMHYLLKYRYKTNWSREVLENYLPVSFETVITKIPSNYKVIYNDQFIVPFISEQTFKDFGIKMDQNTHTKLIIENEKI